MFKEGDKLVCIDNKNECLTIGKSYITIYVYNEYNVLKSLKGKTSNKISINWISNKKR